MSRSRVDIVDDHLSPALYEVLAALDDGPIVDLSGRATIRLAERLDTTPADARARVAALVDLELMAPPRMHRDGPEPDRTRVPATRCYEYRRVDQTSRFDDMRAAHARRSSSATRPATDEDARAIEVEAASTVVPEGVTVLWRQRLIKGAINVIAGKPGLGKSALSTTIAADLSREGHVAIIANLEDDRHTVIRPRLDAAEAVNDNVFVLPPEQAPLFPDDLEAIRRLITKLAASVLILDPVSGFFRSETAMHNRVNLGRLANIARQTGCAIVGVHHTIKSTLNLATALDAIGGPASGLTAAARAAYVFGPDPTDFDRRALGCVKMNGLDAPPAIAIGHETFEMASPAGGVLTASRLRFEEELNVDPLLIVQPDPRWMHRADADCRDWLAEFFDGGTRTEREVFASAKDAGFNQAVVRRAALGLGLTKVTVDRALGADGVIWSVAVAQLDAE
ncbi:MAG TPA: AAA family ATPase [Acidimicrobiales bacterium]|nr:AAA family ATPase [Acidimicrobiales bacterium]